MNNDGNRALADGMLERICDALSLDRETLSFEALRLLHAVKFFCGSS